MSALLAKAAPIYVRMDFCGAQGLDR